MKLQPAHKKILEYLQEYGSANTFKLSRDLEIERGELISLVEELTKEGLTKFRSGTVIKGDKPAADQKIIDMSEIALGTISCASAQSKPAISEHAQMSKKPSFFEHTQKPEVSDESSVFDTEEKKPVSKPILILKTPKKSKSLKNSHSELEKVKERIKRLKDDWLKKEEESKGLIEGLESQRDSTAQKLAKERALLYQVRKEKRELEESLAVCESSLNQREESVQKREKSISAATKRLKREKEELKEKKIKPMAIAKKIKPVSKPKIEKPVVPISSSTSKQILYPKPHAKPEISKILEQSPRKARTIDMSEIAGARSGALAQSKPAISEHDQKPKVFDMSEIANAHAQGVLTRSKQAISECLKAKLSNKPEICKANFSVHAQKHAPHSSKMCNIFDCAQKSKISDISAGSVFDKIAVSKTETEKPEIMPEELWQPATRISEEKIGDKFHDLIEQEISLLKQRRIEEARNIHLQIKDMIGEVTDPNQRKMIIKDWNRIKEFY